MNLKHIEKTFVRQHDASDCGVACLLSIINYFEGQNTLENLRRVSGTTKVGTTLLGLCQSAEKIGFNAQGASGNMEELLKQKNPVILHVKTDQGLLHYVVFYGVIGDRYMVGDPAQGVVEYNLKELDKLWESKHCLLLEPKEEFIKQETKRAQKRKWFFKLLKPDAKVLQFSVFLGVIIAVMSMALSVFSQKLVDDILPSKEIAKLVGGIGLLFVILLIKVCLSALREYFLVFQRRAFNVRIIDTFYSSLLKLPKSFFDTRKIGELVARLNDTSRIQRVIKTVIGNAIIDGLVTIISFGFLFVYHWKSAVIALVTLPVYFMLLYKFNKRIIKSQQNIMKAYAFNESNYISTMQGIVAIKNNRREQFFKRLNQHIYGLFQNEVFTLGKINIRLGLLSGLAAVFFMIAIISLVSYEVIQELLPLGSLFAILGIVGGLLPSVTNLALLAIPINEAKIAFDRMFEFTSIEKESIEGGKVKNINSIHIQQASFRFPGRTQLFKDVSINIEKGQIIGIQGKSGSGKTTLGAILQKHYELESGSIEINDMVTLDSIKTSLWRKRIGVVEQNPALFSGTVIDNIILGAEKKPDQIESFIKSFGFDEYFLKFPTGYATPLGEEGINISGGQLQLVAFARALFQNPKVLILDEFTAAMDEDMEAFVFKVLQKLKSKTIIILITHKRGVLRRNVDKIYSFDSMSQVLV